MPTVDVQPSAAALEIAIVKRVVAEACQISVAQLDAKCRTEPLATVRRIALALCDEITSASRVLIGEEFGGRCETTVSWACITIADECTVNGSMAARVGALRAKCIATMNDELPASAAKQSPGLRIFAEREIREAYAYAAQGGQALHLMGGRYAYLRDDTPACFKGRGELAHLFDQDRKRLEASARRLGVRVIRVERPGTPQQHIDLCGKPLERAKELAMQLEWEREHGLLDQPHGKS